MKRKNLIAFLAWLALAVVPTSDAHAADVAPAVSPQNTGTIEGRVFNPLTGQYIRNAELRVQGSDAMAVTGGDGRYRITNVPAGNVTITVTYTGYLPGSVVLPVREGETAKADFDLQSTSAQQNDKVIELDRFTVSSRREGTAKAIMEQRNSLNVKNIIASDTFGDMIEGNIAEVVQYMPGIAIQYCGGDPINVQMRGVAARYGALMVDGVRTSSSLGAGIGANSANAADTIEYTKTNSADMDGDAPAGTMNMKSKSAFQRKGRFFSYQLFGLVNSYQLHLSKSDGPNDGQSYKTLPGATLDYSDTWLDGRLGIVLNISETNSANEQAILRYTYDTTPTAARPAPVVVTTINYTNGPKVNRRQGGGLNLEYKLTPSLTVALRSYFNNSDARIYNRQVQLVSTRVNQTAESNAVTMIATPTANNATRVTLGAGVTTMRTTTGHTLAPALMYEGKKLSFDATFSYSRSGTYSRNGRLNGDRDSFAGSTHQLFGIGFTARRAAAGENAWDFQLGLPRKSGHQFRRL